MNTGRQAYLQQLINRAGGEKAQGEREIERGGQTDRDRRTERHRKQRERGELRERDRRTETDGRRDIESKERGGN